MGVLDSCIDHIGYMPILDVHAIAIQPSYYAKFGVSCSTTNV